MESEAVPFGTRLSQLAAEDPEGLAAVLVTVDGEHHEHTFAELDRAANQVARFLIERGVGHDDVVVVGLPRCDELWPIAFGIWKAGAIMVPLRDDLPVPERDGLLGLAAPRLVIADWDDVAAAVSRRELRESHELDDAPLPPLGPSVPLMTGSGGSTGRPKLIRTPLPSTVTPGQPFNPVGALVGLRPGQVVFTGSPPYHFMGFGAHLGILEGGTSVVLERFDPALLLDAIERYRIGMLTLVPIMMQRLARHPGIDERDLSSVGALVHSAAPCPPWLKRRWIDLLGPDKVFEIYSSTEQVGFCLVSGTEWLERPGTVGKGVMTEIRITDAEGEEVPAGEVGEIHMRLAGLPEPLYQYVGAERGPVTSDGFASVGDLGWVDGDGYLFIADRRTDLIISGGANVYPAEVEAALTEHPDVADVAVVGVPDDEWGRRVHAVVEAVAGATLDPADLDAHCRARIAAYKVPRSYEIVDALPRNEAGKVRRSALIP